MIDNYYRVQANIDIDAIRKNILNGRSLIKDGTKLMAVVKSDAYGHGADVITKNIDDIVDAYAVATVREGVRLRKNGITKPILNLGYTAPEEAELAILHEIRMATFNLETAKAYSEVAKKVNKTALIHIKLDTGMSRIGFLVTEEEDINNSLKEVLEISKLDCVEIEGMFTHYSKADELDKTFARNQFKKYMHFNELLLASGIDIPVKHVCNSAGIIDIPESNLDMVRFGITMYGMYPTDEVTMERLPVYPAMEIKTHISMLKTLKPGVGIGYSGTFVTERETILATIPVGYGDGYPRGLSNAGRVLIHGISAPIRGRICMDQCMIDVTDIKDVKVGDVVTLMGRDGNEFISAEEIGATVGNSFHYEVVCDISKRVPRVYFRDGKVIDVVDYLDMF